jgi:hypothetical protein
MPDDQHCMHMHVHSCGRKCATSIDAVHGAGIEIKKHSWMVFVVTVTHSK